MASLMRLQVHHRILVNKQLKYQIKSLDSRISQAASSTSRLLPDFDPNEHDDSDDEDATDNNLSS